MRRTFVWRMSLTLIYWNQFKEYSHLKIGHSIDWLTPTNRLWHLTPPPALPLNPICNHPSPVKVALHNAHRVAQHVAGSPIIRDAWLSADWPRFRAASIPAIERQTDRTIFNSKARDLWLLRITLLIRIWQTGRRRLCTLHTTCEHAARNDTT